MIIESFEDAPADDGRIAYMLRSCSESGAVAKGDANARKDERRADREKANVQAGKDANMSKLVSQKEEELYALTAVNGYQTELEQRQLTAFKAYSNES